jgi:hypothetical protein
MAQSAVALLNASFATQKRKNDRWGMCISAIEPPRLQARKKVDQRSGVDAL